MSEKPDVLFILLDDFGWKDSSCYGSDFYETPNIDALAEAGMKFNQAYAACPVCSPTRAAIMSGKYPARLGVTQWIAHGKFNSPECHPRRGRVIGAPYVKKLDTAEKSLASALKDGGYKTWHVGKWHLGEEPYYPEKHGFDINEGGCEWGMPHNGYFSPWGIPGLDDAPDGTYLTDHLTDKAIELIEKTDRDTPFFLNMWYYSVHTPIQAKPEIIEKYRKKSNAIGLSEKKNFVDGGPAATLIMHKRKAHIKKRVIQSDPVYAAMIETLDSNIGRLVDTLKKTGRFDNTLIIFTSDNGGLSSYCGKAPTCNFPLNEGKGWMYEGGVREPLIVSWPEKIKKGSVSEQPVTSTDFYPTILEATGLKPEPEQHVDGVSIMPVLQGNESFSRGTLFWHYPHYSDNGGSPGASLRDKAYKLIKFFEDDRIELYDLEKDLREETDIASEMPGKVAELHEKLIEWQKEVGALFPEKNPDYAEQFLAF